MIMNKKLTTGFSLLPQEMQDALEPFLEEWDKLTSGEQYEVKAMISYPFGQIPSGVQIEPMIEFTIPVFLKWNMGFTACWEDKIKKRLYPKEVYDCIIKNSPQMNAFNERIRKFVNDTQKVGKKKFNNKDALWEAWFW
jgi:hypothetical protein